MTTWTDPRSGRPIEIGQLVNINASGRLGPSAIGWFVVLDFTDEGIIGEPSMPREDYSNAPIRFQPEDIVKLGASPA